MEPWLVAIELHLEEGELQIRVDSTEDMELILAPTQLRSLGDLLAFADRVRKYNKQDSSKVLASPFTLCAFLSPAFH